MAGPRCFVKGDWRAGEAVDLPAEEAHHLARVLRVRAGGVVTVLNGAGQRGSGTLRLTGKRASVALERVEVEPVAAIQLNWVQALPKGRLLDNLLRQAVEIGVGRVVPVTSEHCEVRLEAGGKRPESKRERWRLAAIEALKQSGNAWLPEIEPVRPFAEWVVAWQRASAAGAVLLAGSLEPGARLLGEVLAELPSETRSVTLAIGPEGDFSRSEYAALREAGARAVRFGKTVLRVDTAALYGLSVADQWRCGRACGANEE